MRGTVQERFEDKYIPEPMSGCWLWTASVNKKSYGLFRLGETVTRAHRASWEINNGTIPDGLSVLHKCDVRSCVNPDHLFLGTQADNVEDMMTKGRDRHPKGEENWYSKLTEKKVLKIYQSLESSSILAAKFDVSRQQVYRIRNGKAWLHLTKHKGN